MVGHLVGVIVALRLVVPTPPLSAPPPLHAFTHQAPARDVPAPIPPPPVVPIGLGPYLTLAAGSGADLGTTLAALAVVRDAYEANPLLAHGGSAGFILGKVATTAALMLVMRRLVAHGHPTMARVIGYGSGAALGGVAAHNARLGR